MISFLINKLTSNEWKNYMIILSFSSHFILKKYASFTLKYPFKMLPEHFNRVESWAC